MDILDQVLARAVADSDVRGVILSGSRARGTQTARSDYDVTIVVTEQAQPWQHNRTNTLDQVVCTVAALADTSVYWPRYGFRGAKVLLDQLYRSVKSRRDGFTDAALLDEMESTPWLLETVFALHGRLRPYNKYLRWELENFPLPDSWNTALMPDRVGAAALRLFPAVENLARQHGHADVLDSWGSDIELIRTFADAVAPDRSQPLRVEFDTP